MSTEKSLIKHLKSKDEFLVANFSNYFEKHTGRDSSSYIQHTLQGVSRRTVFQVGKELRETGTLSSPQRSKRGQYKPVKGLTSWLSFVVSNCEFVTFPLVSWVGCGT